MPKGKKEKQAPPKQRRPERRYLPALREERSLVWADNAPLLVLGAVLFAAPYFRGLFFPQEQRWALLAACLAFVLVWLAKLRRQEVSFLGRPFDYLALTFPLLYVLSAFRAASLQLAVAEVVKVTLYFLVYWMASQLGRERRGRYFLLATIYAAAVGVALAGVLTAQGVIFIKDGFVGGRIYSTLQYPNALANYLAAASFLGLFLWVRAPRGWRFVLAGGTYLLFLVLLGTGSRGGLVLYPPVALVFFVGAPAGDRGRLVWHMLAGWAAALVANSRFLPLVVAGQHTAAWQWLGLGLLLSLALQSVYELAGLVPLARRARLVAGVAGALLAVGGGAFYYLRQAGEVAPAAGFWSQLVPPQLAARLADISLETFGAATRLQWSQDALQLVKARPFLGYGGGAWEAAYQSYQSYYYTSTQVHNHYFQIWSEIGTVGLLVFLAIWFFFLLTAWANYRSGSREEKLFQWSLLGCALSLGLHAILDFDLALSAVALVLWSCFGLTRALERERQRENYFLRRHEFRYARTRYLAAVILAALVMAWLPGGLLLGEAMARRAVAAVRANQGGEALTFFRRATILDPFNASYQMDRAGLLLAYGKTEEALALAAKAACREPFNRRLLTRLGELYWQAGKPDAAVEAMRQARQAAPWVTDAWENTGRVAALAGISYLRSGQREKARVFLEEAAGLPAKVEAKLAGLSPENRRLWEAGGRPMLTVTPSMQLSAGMALYGLGRPREALHLLERAMKDDKVKAEALYWASLSYRLLGEATKAQALRQEVETLAPDLAKSYTEMAQVKTL